MISHEKGVVKFITGISAREKNGSRDYYFADLSVEETSLEGTRSAIAAKCGIQAADISLMHPKENKSITEGTIKDSYPDGIVHFEYGKISPVDDNGSRRLEFVEKQVKELTSSEMRDLIADRLEVPRFKVELIG